MCVCVGCCVFRNCFSLFLMLKKSCSMLSAFWSWFFFVVHDVGRIGGSVHLHRTQFNPTKQNHCHRRRNYQSMTLNVFQGRRHHHWWGDRKRQQPHIATPKPSKDPFEWVWGGYVSRCFVKMLLEKWQHKNAHKISLIKNKYKKYKSHPPSQVPSLRNHLRKKERPKTTNSLTKWKTMHEHVLKINASKGFEQTHVTFNQKHSPNAKCFLISDTCWWCSKSGAIFRISGLNLVCCSSQQWISGRHWLDVNVFFHIQKLLIKYDFYDLMKNAFSSHSHRTSKFRNRLIDEYDLVKHAFNRDGRCHDSKVKIWVWWSWRSLAVCSELPAQTGHNERHCDCQRHSNSCIVILNPNVTAGVHLLRMLKKWNIERCQWCNVNASTSTCWELKNTRCMFWAPCTNRPQWAPLPLPEALQQLHWGAPAANAEEMEHWKMSMVQC